MRQLYHFTKIPVKLLIIQYKLRRSIIERILRHNALSTRELYILGDPLLLPISKSIRKSNTGPNRGITQSLTLLYFIINHSLNTRLRHLSAGSSNEAVFGILYTKSPTL
jgi:hypothetical protein